MSWLGVLCHRCAHIMTAFTCEWSDYLHWIVAMHFSISHCPWLIGYRILCCLLAANSAFTICVYQVVFTHVKHHWSASKTELVQTAAKIKTRVYFPHYTRKKKNVVETLSRLENSPFETWLIEAAFWTVVASDHLEYLKMNVDDEPCHNQMKPCLY